MISLIGHNIVLLADKHNPSIVSKEWVRDNEIITGEIVNFAQLPVASVIEDLDYNLFVDQDIFRLTLKDVDSENINNSYKIVQKYIKKLPEVPYKAMGINFLFNLTEDSLKLNEIFIKDEKKIKEIFSENYTFGEIIKFKYNEFSVTTKLMPLNNNEIKADFNFHLESINVNELLSMLEQHSNTLEKSYDVLRKLFED